MKYETIYKNVGSRLTIAADNCIRKAELQTLVSAAHQKTIAKSKHKKVYYACPKFPRKIAQRAGFVTVTDPNDADLIIIPVYYVGVYVTELYAERIKEKLYRRWDYDINCDRYVSVYKLTNKYLNLMDEYKGKCVISSNFYVYCRYYNPALTDKELENVKNLLDSSDQECRLLGATMIMQSNLDMRKNSQIIRQAYNVFPQYQPTKTYTNELFMFMETVLHKIYGHYSQFVVQSSTHQLLKDFQ